MFRTQNLVAVIAFTGAGVMAGSADAAVTYGGSFQSWERSNTTNTTNFDTTGLTFDASSFDKLVVIATTENGNGGATAGFIGSVTYDGVALTEAVFSSGQAADAGPPAVPFNQTYISIWYLDNPTTTGGVIATTGNNRIAATAFGLNGTAAGAGNTLSVKDVYSDTLITTGTDSMIVSALGMGGSGNNADVGDVDPDSGTEISGIEFGSNWGGHVAAYEANAAPAIKTVGFTDADPTNDVSLVAVEFLAIPEPSSLALLGLGGLLIARRRRG